jgi:2,4-dienoyl-CoA reductase-like NADH-dependent reductase (Old Yellow Enzyme family)
MATKLTDPLKLPCGAVISNRVAKPAITEGLADPRGWPTVELERLYSSWADSGFGLMVTGNIVVDGDHLERAGNVIIESQPSAAHMAALRSWTKAARKNGAHVWAQLSHSGRQTQKVINPTPLAPSAVEIGLPGGQFGKPKAMTSDEIVQVVHRFALAARVCKEAGFTGVQIHAAHGYLISSFLSPKTNLRTDQCGGSLDNRARVLMSIVAETRKAVGAGFAIGVKLNSADFQKGGFTAEESTQVALKLERAGVDLLEISGGSYENPAMVGEQGGATDNDPPPKKASTLAREAYFLDFARALRKRVKMPIMLTGGLRTREGMQAALDEGVDMLGIARPVCVDPACVKPLLDGQVDALPLWEEHLRRKTGIFTTNSPVSLIRTLSGFAGIYWFYVQIYKLGRGEEPVIGKIPMLALLEVMQVEKRLLALRRKTLEAEAKTVTKVA